MDLGGKGKGEGRMEVEGRRGRGIYKGFGIRGTLGGR